MIQSFVVTELATGKRFICERKQSWNKIYYRFGDGEWYRSRGEAFRAAKSAGTLNALTPVATNPERESA